MRHISKGVPHASVPTNGARNNRRRRRGVWCVAGL
jgi:hypothetical protein